MSIRIVGHPGTQKPSINKRTRTGLRLPCPCGRIPLPCIPRLPTVDLAARDHYFVASDVIGHAEVRAANRHIPSCGGHICPRVAPRIEFPDIIQMRCTYIVPAVRSIGSMSTEKNDFVTHWMVDHPMADAGARSGAARADVDPVEGLLRAGEVRDRGRSRVAHGHTEAARGGVARTVLGRAVHGR